MHQPIFNHLPVQQTKHLGDLPLNIQFTILQLCSPSDLADISRVHSSLQDVAERALYSHIRFSVPPLDISLIPDGDSVPSSDEDEDESFLLLLRTFSGNPKKALMVKKFYVKLETDRRYEIESKVVGYLLVKLADALEKMTNLVDLRIIYNLGVDLSKGRISEVIRGGHFTLHTLYLEQSHDLERIIADQPQIRILAFYHAFLHSVGHLQLWKKIEGLHRNPTRRRSMPTIFGIDGSSTTQQIDLLPSFNRPKETLRVCQEIMSSLDLWSDAFSAEEDDGYEIALSLVGISKANLGLITEMMKVIVKHLNNYCQHRSCSFLKIIVPNDKFMKKLWRLTEFTGPLARFVDLSCMIFVFLGADREELDRLQPSMKASFRKMDFGRTWPRLFAIQLCGYHQRNWTESTVSWHLNLW